ncbi:MAG: sigma-54-dependent transcriptional regulator [Candidatus Cryptobacteroides sp.]
MSEKGTLLVADDNKSILASVKLLMESEFDHIITVSNPAEIPAALREGKPDVVLLDMNYRSGINNGNEGIYWLSEIRRLKPGTQVVLFTAYADIELAVRGIQEGASDFIVKPFDNNVMKEKLLAAYRKSTGKSRQASQSNGKTMFWGSSRQMTSLKSIVEKVASTDANILITGENGTGKEMLATAVHELSARSSGPMVTVDMGAITETLFESELFGHVKGAFTDARADREGKFQAAEGGTLFLDEIGNLSYSLQAKLLTAIQRKSVVRVGDNKPIPVNVRLICATNKNLDQMVSQGQFREDLLYRINTIRLEMPPLRDRKEDIVPLAGIFLKKYGDLYGKQQVEFSEEARQKLVSQTWQGNVRELEHAVEKAVILSDSSIIGPEDIESGHRHSSAPDPANGGTLEDMECRMIANAISECSGNLSLVASRLGITRQTLYNKIKKYGL